MENSPEVLFGALVVPDGSGAVQALAGNGHTIEFVKDQFRHCKSILALGAGRELLEMAGIGSAMDEDPGIPRRLPAAGIGKHFWINILSRCSATFSASCGSPPSDEHGA